jgi:hypothetical protein
MPSEIEVHVAVLRSEDAILKKLLYRNSNQHGKTKVFGLFSQVRYGELCCTDYAPASEVPCFCSCQSCCHSY